MCWFAHGAPFCIGLPHLPRPTGSSASALRIGRVRRSLVLPLSVNSPDAMRSSRLSPSFFCPSGLFTELPLSSFPACMQTMRLTAWGCCLGTAVWGPRIASCVVRTAFLIPIILMLTPVVQLSIEEHLLILWSQSRLPPQTLNNVDTQSDCMRQRLNSL